MCTPRGPPARHALRLRGSGAASSIQMPISAPLEMEAGTLAEQIFSQLSTDEFGKLPVDELVWQAKCWFETQPTVQPEAWIRAIIAKRDLDGDGWMQQEEFAAAVEELRRC